MTGWKVFSKRQGERISYEVDKELLVEKTRFQRLEILHTVSYGLALFLDDKIQSSELDEFIYHEALAHPVLVSHPRPQRVLIIGSGEGALLREALRHNTVRQVVMVDIDAEVVNAAKKYLLSWHQGAFADDRVELIHTDARAYLENDREAFDCIIVDVTDPLPGGPAYRLFTKEFYELAHARLSREGTIAVQAESADLGVLETHQAIINTLGKVFPSVFPYRAHVPSFGESWGFALGMKTPLPQPLPSSAVDETLHRRGCLDLRFYDGEAHDLLFTSPKYFRTAKPVERIISDNDPLFVT